jgi:hypothetical protein
MIYTSEDNWYNWNYDNNPIRGRSSSGNSIFNTYYGKYDGPVGSFKEELSKAANSTLDAYPGLRPCIFFSGGVDSEVVLRAYLDIGITPDVYIIRYEKDLNIYDVSYAVTICSMLAVDYRIIDFKIQKFYETDAEHISEVSQIDRPRALPHLKFLDYVEDNQFGIYGIGDPRWSRIHDNYNVKSEWLLIDQEHDTGWDKYLIHKNVPAIAQWFKWTPSLVLSYTKLKWFKQLISDQYIGKLGVTSTKIIGYREAYPDLIYRKKQTGFELIDNLILEFENFLDKKYNGLSFRRSQSRTLEQLWIEITGKHYPEY